MARRVVAIVYDDLARAEAALAAVEELEPLDAAIVVRDRQGRVVLHQTHEVSSGEGAIAGGTVGLLAGLFFGLPIAPALVGLAAGAGLGARDTGIADDRLRLLGESLGGDEALLCVLVEQESVPGAVDGLAVYGGEVVDAEVPLP